MVKALLLIGGGWLALRWVGSKVAEAKAEHSAALISMQYERDRLAAELRGERLPAGENYWERLGY